VGSRSHVLEGDENPSLTALRPLRLGDENRFRLARGDHKICTTPSFPGHVREARS
jgi:hypothetical protein